MRPHFLVAVGSLLVAALPIAAQPAGDPRSVDPTGHTRYVPFRIDPNAEALVQGQLDALKQLAPYKEFLEKILREPEKYGLNPKGFRQMDLENPKVQERLKKWVEESARGTLPESPQERQKFKDAVQKIIKYPLQKAPPTDLPFPPIESSPAVEPPAPDADTPARDWLKELMERAEHSRLGERLRESPAWRDVLEDLTRHASARFPAPDPTGLERLTGSLFKLDRIPLPDLKALERLGSLKPPNLSRWTPSLPSVSRPVLPSVAPPSLPTVSSLETLAVWLLCLGIAVVFIWQVSKLIPRQARRGRHVADLGPWPADPRSVATRAELIQAFDHVALLLLGRRARSWHHHAVARAVAQRDVRLLDTATGLAALYEHARYTPGPEPLSDDDCEQARRALVQLAKVAEVAAA
jgi:hypothetical protein